MAGTVHIVDSTSWSDPHAARLRLAGFVVLRAQDRESAERLLRRRPADQITIVDEPDGCDAAALLAAVKAVSAAPAVVVASMLDEERFLGWFAAGADDVVSADCGPDLFLARVRAVLRRAGGLPEVDEGRISIGDVTVEDEPRRVVVRDRPVHLTPLEFSLLYTLMRDPGVVYSREDLLDTVWGSRDVAVERTIDAHIWKLRRKIEPNAAQPRHILSVPRLGYRFRRPDGERAALAG